MMLVATVDSFDFAPSRKKCNLKIYSAYPNKYAINMWLGGAKAIARKK